MNRKPIELYLDNKIDEPQPGGPFLTKIISDAAEYGYPLPAIKTHLFKACDKPDVQQAWGNWQNINDREEVRLRLQAILGFSSLDTSLAPFILFFFRASDPVVYQLAARIVGKWLHADDEIQNYINQYLILKKVKVEQPIQLIGQRARRRLLIALTEHYALHGPIIHLDGRDINLAFPLDVEGLEHSLPPSQLDISVIMQSLGILHQHGNNSATSLTKKMLSLPAMDLFTPEKWDRNIIRNWGILLSTSPENSESKKAYWKKYLQKSLNHYSTSLGFAGKLHSLYKIDEVLRSAVFSLELSKEAIDISHSDNFDLISFCRIRLIHWMAREKVGIISSQEFPVFDNNAPDSQLLRYIGKNILYRQPEQDLLQTFLFIVEGISTNSKWRLQPVTERAWRAFFLLDFSIHSQSIPQDELQQLITVLSTEKKLVQGNFEYNKLHLILPAVLNRLIEAEQTAGGNIPDGKLIHKISDESLLLELLPSNSDSEHLPVLADAIENQIRLLLTTKPIFNLDHYLYQLSIREPNRKFYRYIRELSRERNYTTVDKQPTQFSEKIDYLYQQSENNREGKLPKELTGNRFWSSIQTIRDRLNDKATADNLFTLLVALEHELDGTGAETITPESTLHDLANIVQPKQGYWLQSGYPAQFPFDSHQFNQKLLDLQKKINQLHEKLVPKHLNSVDELGETVQRIKEVIDSAVYKLGSVLSENESFLIYKIKDRIHLLLNNWIYSIQSVSTCWKGMKKESPAEGVKLWSAVFDEAVDQSNEVNRPAVLNLVLNTLFSSGDIPVQKNWYRRYQILSWACQPSTLKRLDSSTKEHWLSILRQHWKEMLHSAMEQKQEARVLQLVRAPELSALRNTDSINQLLKDVKTWCFERYDFNHATICNREINPDLNPVQAGWITLREYFSHFGKVWIALIIGVILMFDFGDPWTELAEIGDIGGVIFTFILGVGGTYLYVFADLRKKVTFVKTDPFHWVSQFWRVGLFLAISLLFTVLVVLLFWYMFSSTDQVVHGINAIWHIMAWTGFALFIGVFFGLIGKQ